MRKYELTVILPGADTEAKQKKTLEKIEKLVSGVSGEVLSSTSWGKKDLFYPIAKQKAGVYYFLNLAIPPEGAAVVNREVQLDGDILRHLLVVGEEVTVTKPVSSEGEGKVVTRSRKTSPKRASKPKPKDVTK